MEIKKPEDLADIMTDMFDEFMEDLIEKDWAARPVDDDDNVEDEWISHIYTRRGIEIAETYVRRMTALWDKIFPEELELDLKSHYFQSL